MHAFKIRVMLRLCGSSYILFTIFAATTFVVTATNCNRNCIQDPSSLRDERRSNPQQRDSNPSQSLRRGCCPYDFDRNICNILDDRVLCGYNKNIGMPKSKNSVVELTGGCRIRGGRLECGYHRGPYTNPRRPTVGGNQLDDRELDRDGPPTHRHRSDERGLGPTRIPFDVVTSCVEIDDRIICRKV